MERETGEYVEANLSRSIVGAFLDSYHKLGFGFLESVYANALCRELVKRGHRVEREVRIAVMYDGERIGWFRCDVLVEGRIVLEIKAAESLAPFAKRQLLNYLRATNYRLGIVLHYGPQARYHRVLNSGFIPVSTRA